MTTGAVTDSLQEAGNIFSKDHFISINNKNTVIFKVNR